MWSEREILWICSYIQFISTVMRNNFFQKIFNWPKQTWWEYSLFRTPLFIFFVLFFFSCSSNWLVLVRVKVDLDSIPWKLGVRWTYTLYGIPVHPSEPCMHSHICTLIHFWDETRGISGTHRGNMQNSTQFRIEPGIWELWSRNVTCCVIVPPK